MYLPHTWVYWKTNWKKAERTIARCHEANTLRGFWDCLWNHHPSTLENQESLHIFKEGIWPLREDAANKGGGEIKVTCKNYQGAEEMWQVVAKEVVNGKSKLYQKVCVLCTHDPKGSQRAMCPRFAKSRLFWTRFPRQEPPERHIERCNGAKVSYCASLLEAIGRSHNLDPQPPPPPPLPCADPKWCRCTSANFTLAGY